MTTCTESGCGGTIAADGYCDTCGVKPATGPGPAATGAGGGAVAAPPVSAGPVVGGPCGRNGCGGTVAADGYCDTCGLAIASAGSPAAPAAPPGPAVGGGDTPSIAAPQPPTTSTRIRSAGTEMAKSRRTVTSQRTASARSGIGRGLVVVPPTPVGDPAAAVMSEERIQASLGEVPEEDRHCSSCGRPVGQSADGKPGRVKGFCGTCRTPFDFVTNEPILRPGELVAGQYQILGPLAHGGMGWIYLGQDKAVSDRWVVLKGLLNEADQDAVLAAVAERQFLAQIEHANIVNIYNFVTHRGAGYIVMEMVGGESLNAKLKRRRADNGGVPDPLPATEAIAYILGVLPAFGYLHEHGLVYNDLKPANIMAVGEEVKLIDLGAVMRADDHFAAIFGTQGFQAPEVATEGPSISSDLYTVGRTLAVLMLRFTFHDGPHLHALPDRAEEPLFARWESLHRFLLRACAFHPDDRFQSADEMSQQLTGVLREMVSITEGRARTTTSTLFESDQLVHLLTEGATAYDVDEPDWRVLPSARVNPEDPAAAFLTSLPDHDPARAIRLLDTALADGQIAANDEVRLFRARELVRMGHDPATELAAVDASNPWEWRSRWYRALHQLQSGSAAAAAEGFSEVWTELPGESAPKMAVGLAAELAGAFDRAAEVYEVVIRADSAQVSAAFGLARCRRRLGDAQQVIEAFGMVPSSSAAHYDAQVATARALVSANQGAPTVAQLQAASATIERLQLDAMERAEFSADVYQQALEGLADGTIAADSTPLLGRQIDEKSLRIGLEQTYRTMARQCLLVDVGRELGPLHGVELEPLDRGRGGLE
ncbi:MAG: tetratricopeptide repeat protein, partial [Actinomycetota bacterium]